MMEKGLLEIVGPTGISFILKKIVIGFKKIESTIVPMHIWWLCLALF
jgi:hypothetical protein